MKNAKVTLGIVCLVIVAMIAWGTVSALIGYVDIKPEKQAMAEEKTEAISEDIMDEAADEIVEDKEEKKNAEAEENASEENAGEESKEEITEETEEAQEETVIVEEQPEEEHFEEDKVSAPSSEAEEIVEDEDKDKEWKALYKELLLESERKLNADYQCVKSVVLEDFNKDGVPEIIVSGHVASAAYNFGIYQIIDGKVEPIYVSGDVNCGFYSNFGANWFMMMINSKTGEVAYRIDAGNGSDEDSFDGIYFIRADEAGKIYITEEFYSDEYWVEGESNVYMVRGQTVTEEEYEAERELFFDTWYEINSPLHIMGTPDVMYKKYGYENLTAEKIDELFDLYRH